MADTIRSAPTEKKITHHVKLSNGGTELGLILCDGRGNPSTQGIRQGKMPNRSLQISQGDPDYSDMELPYTPITQKDWSGGRGNKYFEQDKSRYADGQNTDASKGEVILGPKATVLELSAPLDDITNSQDESGRFPNPYGSYTILIESMFQYIIKVYWSSRFQWTSANNLGSIKIWLAKTNKVKFVIIKHHTIDLSTEAKRDSFNSALLGNFPAGTNLSTYDPTYEDCEVVYVSGEYSITSSDSLTEYSFEIPVNMDLNEYYMLSVISLKPITYPKLTVFDIDPIFGLNSVSSGLDIRGIYGNFKLSSMGFGPIEQTLYLQTTSGLGSLAYELSPTPTTPGSAHFFTIRNTKFVVTSPSDGSAPKLYMEGYHGYAWDDNNGALEKLFSKNIGSEAVGANVKIVGGPGSTELIRWREIESVTTGASGYVTVDSAWNIEHTTSTEFAIFGTGQWTEITGHGLTAAVTDVIVVNDIVYFAQGEDVAIRRMTFYNNSGVWTPKYWTETAKASYLALIQNEEGTQKIWRALSSASTVSSSAVVAWADAADILTFGTAITCGNTMYRINGLVAYGTPRIPYVLKQDGFGAISNDIYDQVPLAEFAAVADDNNGRANLQRGVYLFLSMLNGLERYYEGRLDDIGPNRDEGFPNNRNGRISSLLAYPGRMYASIDHPTGYSSVMLYNDIGWHEIYRSSLGARIYAIDVQVIDGDKCDRIWIAQEGSITYFPVAIDPRKQSDYTYSSTGSIETSWINGNFAEIKKFYSSIMVFSENLVAGEQYIRISYKVDDDNNDWTEIDENVDESPSQEVAFPNHAVYGKRIKLKFTLYTADNLKTPRIKGITIKPVTRLPLKKSWSMTFRIDDSLFDMQSVRSENDAYELMAQIESWADSDTTPTPLLMNVPHLLFNNKYVFVEPESLRPIEWVTDDNRKKMVAIGQLTVYEA